MGFRGKTMAKSGLCCTLNIAYPKGTRSPRRSPAGATAHDGGPDREAAHDVRSTWLAAVEGLPGTCRSAPGAPRRNHGQIGSLKHVEISTVGRVSEARVGATAHDVGPDREAIPDVESTLLAGVVWPPGT